MWHFRRSRVFFQNFCLRPSCSLTHTRDISFICVIEYHKFSQAFTTISATMESRVHHFKLVLLGDTAVGKSCLVVRFVRDEFFEFQEPTIGG